MRSNNSGQSGNLFLAFVALVFVVFLLAMFFHLIFGIDNVIARSQLKPGHVYYVDQVLNTERVLELASGAELTKSIKAKCMFIDELTCVVHLGNVGKNKRAFRICLVQDHPPNHSEEECPPGTSFTVSDFSIEAESLLTEEEYNRLKEADEKAETQQQQELATEDAMFRDLKQKNQTPAP